MNVTESRDPSGPSPALLSALTTEHYTLQASRSSTVVEANGRSLLFLSAVSGATVALALVAQLDRMGETFLVFALSVLPALLALGLTSYARLADLAVHDAYYARAIGRIRSFYLTIEPTAREYWLQPAGDDPHAVMRQAGQRHSRWHHLSHTATSVAAVNGVVAGVLVGLVAAVATPLALPLLGAGSTLVAVALFGGLLLDQERRWRLSDASAPTLFLPDGAPAMTVTGFGPGPTQAPVSTAPTAVAVPAV
jgi:purine-cytosine permease-like protein